VEHHSSISTLEHHSSSSTGNNALYKQRISADTLFLKQNVHLQVCRLPYLNIMCNEMDICWSQNRTPSKIWWKKLLSYLRHFILLVTPAGEVFVCTEQ